MTVFSFTGQNYLYEVTERHLPPPNPSSFKLLLVIVEP